MPVSPIGSGFSGLGSSKIWDNSRPAAVGSRPLSDSLDAGAVSPGRDVTEARFVQVLSKAVNDVGGLQRTADVQAMSLLAGGQTELHQAVIATEKAQLALNFALQVRNKVIEAYQEVMRMQV
jgi:flagellar hook-basal body complex protein FliE